MKLFSATIIFMIILSTGMRTMSMSNFIQHDTYRASTIQLYDTTPPIIKDKAYYESRSKREKAGAIILGSVGLLTLAVASAASVNALSNDIAGAFSSGYGGLNSDENSATGATIAMFIGLGLITTAIIIFIASRRHKRKAKLFPSAQSISQGIPKKINNTVPGFTLRIPIGK